MIRTGNQLCFPFHLQPDFHTRSHDFVIPLFLCTSFQHWNVWEGCSSACFLCQAELPVYPFQPCMWATDDQSREHRLWSCVCMHFYYITCTQCEAQGSAFLYMPLLSFCSELSDRGGNNTKVRPGWMGVEVLLAWESSHPQLSLPLHIVCFVCQSEDIIP